MSRLFLAFYNVFYFGAFTGVGPKPNSVGICNGFAWFSSVAVVSFGVDILGYYGASRNVCFYFVFCRIRLQIAAKRNVKPTFYKITQKEYGPNLNLYVFLLCFLHGPLKLRDLENVKN